jgi:chromosome segregation ATPase
MNAQDVALWIGIASSIGGAAVGYGTLTEKVSTLEASTDATHLEARLTKLEVRIEDNDIGHIGTEIEQLRGQVKANANKVEGIRVPSTSQIKSDIRVLQTKVSSIQEELKGLESRLEKVKNKPSNPLL